MYLIWILGSKLILSNNQSRATLWVLETCIIARLLPFMIILITASLSSKMYNIASLREGFAFEETKSTVIQIINLSRNFLSRWRCRQVPLNLFTLIRVSVKNSTDQIPSNLNPASKELISDSVELCETEVCFLHIQLIGTNVWLPKMHRVPQDVDFESSRSPAESES